MYCYRYTPRAGQYTPSGTYTPSHSAVGGGWQFPGVMVKSMSQGSNLGYIVSVTPDSCVVRQPSGQEATHPKYDLEPVRPDTKQETIRVLEGEFAGTIGEILNFDSDEAIVKLKTGSNPGVAGVVQILNVKLMAKFDPSF